jgi:4-amino-4-deoxy-L-arabinose transferase-like glycosyltransferase
MTTQTDNSPTTADRTTRYLIFGWVGVVLLAVGLRLWMWSFQAQTGAVPPGDPEEYYRAALHLLQGSYHDTGKWLRPPIYPGFLALLFTLFGVDLPRALFAQALLMGLATPAFGWFAYRLFRSEPAALLAGFLAAIFLPFVSFSSVLFAEALFLILMILVLAALDRAIEQETIGTAALVGVLLGLAALTRAVALNFIPIAVLLLLLVPLPSLKEWRKLKVGNAIWLLIGAALVIGPWAVRNYAVHQRIILSDTNGGISMWYGLVRSNIEQEAGETQLRAIPNLADRQAQAVRWAVDRIRQDSLYFAGRMRFKISSLYLLQTRSYAVGDPITVDPRDQLVAMGAGENPQTISILADTQYLLIMFAAIIGLAYAPDKRRMIPVLSWVVFITLMSAITIGHPRLRLPIVAALIPAAAFAFTLLRHPPPLSRNWRAAIGLGWLLIMALVFSTRYFGWIATWGDLATANAAIAAADYPTAQQALEQARTRQPQNALRVIDLADLAFRQGKLQQALDLYQEALKLEDRNLYAHMMRMRIAALLNLPDAARAEQMALVGYGREQNEVYSWAWRTFADPLPMRVVPGDPMAIGMFAGFAPVTPDLPSGRWTLAEARVRLAASCGTVVATVRGPAERIIEVALEGRTPQQIYTLTGSDQEIRIAIPCGTDQALTPRPLQQSELVASEETWRNEAIFHIKSPTNLLYLDQAPWHVGVAVLEVRVEP